MSRVFAQRLRQRREALGLHKQDMANKVGVSLTTIQQYEKGQMPKGEFAVRLAEALDCSLDWLLAGKEAVDDGSAGEARLVMVPMVEARLSAGTGSLEVSDRSDDSYAFRGDFLRRKGNPRRMVLMRVSGDSMVPEIFDNDLVLLDRGQTEISPGRLYAVGFEDAIYIKRIDKLPGKIVLNSVNPAYPPVSLDLRGDCADQFRVIGRVLWSGREYR